MNCREFVDFVVEKILSYEGDEYNNYEEEEEEEEEKEDFTKLLSKEFT
ncbi:MAG: hypothetical protein JXA54_13435 [Candidatus Heimdallarchaeota archaeon]|nr:hypothetical protein [Candidatus Heimdallarchaeota archaeon]